MPPKNEITREMLSKKTRACFLVVVKGYTQKEAAMLVGVSEHTMSDWARKHKWKDAGSKELQKLGGLPSIMEGFIAYVKSHMPIEFSGKVEKLWGKYLESLQAGTSNV